MQIVIPMSGQGSRFMKNGYKLPKPLILVDEKPIIAYVIELFSKDDNFIFICNREHLSNKDFQMREVLMKYAPNCKIVEIEKHKLGPVHAINMAKDHIDDEQPTIVNYCDFTCTWNYSNFKKFIIANQPDGIVVTYRGFHPHTLWKDYYGYVKIEDKFIIDYKEKESFTEYPQEEPTSTGTYYFKNGKILKDHVINCISSKLMVNNEYYVSMVYRSMIEENKKILAYEVEHFMQWGTPRDLEEYLYWSNIFKNIRKNKSKISGILLMPMVGVGKRFLEEGFELSKPMIPVSEQPMFINALQFLPQTNSKIAVIRDAMESYHSLKKRISAQGDDFKIITLKGLTDGQAITCLEGVIDIPENQPFTISSCDNGVLYDYSKLSNIINAEDYDIIVWGARKYPGAIRKPKMYGWIELKTDVEIRNISVKEPTSNPMEDPIVIGTFTFKNKEIYISSLNRMKARNGKINNEYYIDSMINDALSLGKRCIYLEVDSYISWGTPAELKTFNYWQSCFHKWNLHPYNVFNDSTISSKCQNELVERINQQSRMFEETKNSVN